MVTVEKIRSKSRSIFKGPIEHIDGVSASPDETLDIQNTACINCEKAYSLDLKVLFVRTAQGLFWWHRHHCAV